MIGRARSRGSAHMTTTPASDGDEEGPTGQTPGSSGAELFRHDVGRDARVSGLPLDVKAQAARRLGVLALLYAFVFFMSNPFPALVFPKMRGEFFAVESPFAHT